MRKLVVSDSASIKIDELLNYLEANWSKKVRLNFFYKMNKLLKQIQEYPDSCPKTDYAEGVRRLIITKQTFLYYNYDDRNIYILMVYDNRMNPKKLRNYIN